MTITNIFQVSLEIWGCIVCIILTIIYGNKAYNKGGPLKRVWVMLILNGLLLVSDSLAYIFRGEVNTLGVIVTQASNFLVFALEGVITYCIASLVQLYIQGDNKNIFKDKWMCICTALIAAQLLGLIVTPFTGFYYSFDSTNHYVRSNGVILSFVALGAVCLISGIRLFVHKKRFTSEIFMAFNIGAVSCLLCLFIQFFTYGLSLINVGLTMFFIILLFAIQKDEENKILQDKIEEMKKIVDRLTEDKKEE